MDSEQYFRSLSLEFESLKDRVRSFIDDAHWLTDGEWKESVLRTILRRNLPNSISVGRGFILTPNRVSKQIDVLIYDQTKPIPFREGDNAFVTPDTAKIVVEVKSKVSNRNIRTIFQKLADNAEFCRVHLGQGIVFSLFSYEESNLTHDKVLKELNRSSNGNSRRIIDFVALGTNKFYRFWELSPTNEIARRYNYWHAYELPNLSFGYFINNIVGKISPEIVHRNRFVWFPELGKERFFTDKILFEENR